MSFGLGQRATTSVFVAAAAWLFTSARAEAQCQSGGQQQRGQQQTFLRGNAPQRNMLTAMQRPQQQMAMLNAGLQPQQQFANLIALQQRQQQATMQVALQNDFLLRQQQAIRNALEREKTWQAQQADLTRQDAVLRPVSFPGDR